MPSNRITVLQVVDLRQDKTVEMDLTKILQNDAKSLLKHKKYGVVLHSDLEPVSGLTEEDLPGRMSFGEVTAPSAVLILADSRQPSCNKSTMAFLSC